MSNTLYGPRMAEALAFAATEFQHKVRKGSGVPYLTHLLQVATWVGEYGGTEDQMIAGVLHDYLEDIDDASPETLETRFGPEVLRLVTALSDSTVQPKPPWEERKNRYIVRLRDEDAAVKLVSCADKLHNATSILRDHEQIGEAIWDRFSASKEQTQWYYGAVFGALSSGWSNAMLTRLDVAVKRVTGL